MKTDEARLFETYFRAYAARVHSFARRRSDADVAQDVTSETFLIAWRRRADMPIDPLPWLYGIARGVLANEHRGANRSAALAARLAAESTSAEYADAKDDHRILDALANLRDADREVLLLSAWEGLSTREGARVVGCSAATFAVRLHRARRRLRIALNELDSETNPQSPTKSLPEASA